MMPSWRARAAIVFGVWAVTFVTLAAIRMRPSAGVLAALAIAASTLLWLVLDLADIAEPVVWSAMRDAGGSQRGADQRVRFLHRRLVEGPALDRIGLLHRTLTTLIDDRLLTEHGTDRRSSPDSAATLLGPELTAFVDDMPSAQRMADPVYLSLILARIEAL